MMYGIVHRSRLHATTAFKVFLSNRRTSIPVGVYRRGFGHKRSRNRSKRLVIRENY